MPDQITTAFVRTFSDNFKLLAQQLETEMRGKVTVETNVKDKKYIDYVGVMGEPQAQAALVEQTNLSEVPHSRRVVLTWPYDLGVPIPRGATLRMLADPTNSYQQSIKGSFERFLEKKLFLAAIGNSISVATEDYTESTIPLPAAQKVTETGTVGMTAAKIVRALTRFNINKRTKSEKFLALSPQAIEDLFLDVDVTYPQQQALELLRTGKMTDLWGFKVMMSTELYKTGFIRSNVAWCKEGLGLGINEDFYSSIDVRPDLKNIKQILAIMDFGCTRLQETDVFELQGYESY